MGYHEMYNSYIMSMRFSGKILPLEESLLNRWDSSVKYKIAQGGDILQFNLGQPDFACPDFVKSAVETANAREKNNFYNHTNGTEGAREAVSWLRKEMFNQSYTKEEIIITNGAKEAIFLALAAILDSGDETIVIAPYWPTYVEAVKFFGGKPVVIDIKKDFHLDIEAIGGALSEKTKAIIINSPNNPSGAIYGRDELSGIAKFAIEHDLVVISDEVYGSTVFDGKKHVSIADFPDMKNRVVLVDGFSKMLSMAGYRLGYAASSKETINNMIKIKSNMNGNTNSFFQIVLEEVLLNHPGEFLKFVKNTAADYEARRDFLSKGLSAMDIRFVRPEGTFYVFAEIPGCLNMKSVEFANALLNKAGVAVAPGVFFGDSFDGYFRISFGASVKSLEGGILRMKKFLLSADKFCR